MSLYIEIDCKFYVYCNCIFLLAFYQYQNIYDRICSLYSQTTLIHRSYWGWTRIYCEYPFMSTYMNIDFSLTSIWYVTIFRSSYFLYHRIYIIYICWTSFVKINFQYCGQFLFACPWRDVRYPRNWWRSLVIS